MPNIEINKDLHTSIISFCDVNDIDDVNGFIEKVLIKGFDMEKYGDSFALFFDKEEADIVRVEEVENTNEEASVEEVEESIEVSVEEVEEPIEKSIEVSVEEVVKTVLEDITPQEPVYKTKKEIKTESVKTPVTIIKKSPKDNYDVYD